MAQKTPATHTQDAIGEQAPLLPGLAQFLDQQRPHNFLWAPVMMGLGIATYFMLKFEPAIPHLAGTGLLFLVSVLAVLSRHVVVRLCLFAIAFFALGFCLATWRANSVAAPVLSKEYFGAVEGRVVGIDRSGSNRVRLTLDQVILYGLEPSDTPERVRISLSSTAPTNQAGERVLVYARLSGPNGPVEPTGFDFRRMAWFSRLGAIGYALGPVLPSLTPQEQDTTSRILRVRMDLSHALQNRIPGAEGGFATAILTGDRSAIVPENLADLRASNLAHLLAISGLHMGLLTGLVFAAVRFGLATLPRIALRYPIKKFGAIAALIAGLAYLVLSGASVATQRAYVMAVVVFVAVLLDRPAFTLRGVALAAMIILMLRPEALTSAGFQMSFAATIGLVTAFDGLRQLSWWKTPQTTIGKLSRPAIVIAFTSAVAGLATGPISAFHFNQVAQYGLLANILAVPVMGFVIMPAAICGILLSPVGLDAIPFWIAGQGIGLVLDIAHWVADLDGALILIPSGPNLALSLIVFGGLLLACIMGRAKALGMPVIVAGLGVWVMSDRPDVLIDPTARLAGVLTPEGRVLTRGRGAGFAASTWLENDGDPASQSAAFKRLDHLPATRTAAMLLQAGFAPDWASICPADTVTLAGKSAPPRGKCVVHSKSTMARTGSVAVWVKKDGLRVLTAADHIGQRLWVPRQ